MAKICFATSMKLNFPLQKNAFSRDHFGFGGDTESEYDKLAMFWIFQQTCDMCNSLGRWKT